MPLDYVGRLTFIYVNFPGKAGLPQLQTRKTRALPWQGDGAFLQLLSVQFQLVGDGDVFC